MGFIHRKSDIDIAAVCEVALTNQQKRHVASAIVDVSRSCPARGVEFTHYRREVAAAPPRAADFEVTANGGPRMATAIHLNPDTESGFWYVLDRAVAHRSGVTISGPRPSDVFAEEPRRTLLDAMHASMALHRVHERATLYSVLNACRAWRFADENVLGSKLEGPT
ncbi:MAG TPA: aminoglycoside adenylyltransferase domain-containing protein [Nocardioidaceae bacterium]|nr:aminoglycoside adenylyltransferase domain-containing protein [Nocardioidaceae bacterium]